MDANRVINGTLAGTPSEMKEATRRAGATRLLSESWRQSQARYTLQIHGSLKSRAMREGCLRERRVAN